MLQQVHKGLGAHMMVLIAVVCFCAATGLVGAARVYKLPEGANSCRIDSPDRDECIRATIERMIPRLSKGEPSLNIPPLDPMVRNATLYEYNRGPLHVLVHAKATTVYGVSKTQVKAVRTQFTEDGMSAEIDTYFPRIALTGAYKADSRYEGLKFSSKGVFNFTFSGLRSTQRMDGHFVDRDGEQYLQLDHFDLDIAMDDFKFYATGIFPDPELNRMAVQFVNQYWMFVYQEILPETKTVWEPLLVKESNDFLSSMPLRTMLYYGEQEADS